MSRRIWIGLFAALIPLGTTAARGQNFGGGFGRSGPGLWVGPGSTVNGDVARGEGVFLWGLGQYAVNSAIGRSIDLTTSIRYNEYIYEVAENMNHQAAKRREAEAARKRQLYQAIQDRLRYNPDDRDLMRGEALNFVLRDLWNPKVDPSVLSMNEVPLKGSTVRVIPFFYGERGSRISMRQLQVKDGPLLTDRDAWPVPLRGDDFRAEREAYKRAVDDYLDLSKGDSVTLPPIKRIQTAVRRLQAKVDDKYGQADVKSWGEAAPFLEKRAKLAGQLGNQRVDDVLRAIERYPGTTVADLVRFMQTYNLQFGEAEDPIERTLYAELYQSLAVQRTVLEDKMGFPIRDAGPRADAGRNLAPGGR